MAVQHCQQCHRTPACGRNRSPPPHLLTEIFPTTDPFPGTAVITEFTSQTNPAFLSWSGADPGFPLSEIREEDGLIRFRAGTGGDSGITGIITDDQQITITGAQAINISGTDLPARVYNLTGTLVYSGTARTITLPAGIYIVTVATKTQKVHITG